jgi:uncharacterized small protein (DUF1192 family)
MTTIQEWADKYPGDPEALKDALVVEIERLHAEIEHGDAHAKIMLADENQRFHNEIVSLRVENKWLREQLPYIAQHRLNEVEHLRAEIERLRAGNERLGPWMSAALSDPGVCEEMQDDIRAWFEAANL